MVFSPFYIKFDVGGALTQNTDLKEFFGENTRGARVRFDPGVRLGFTFGALLKDWFALEGELGYMENNIDAITGPASVDATLANVPFLVNARFQYPNPSRFRPYAGAGLGVAASVIDANYIDYGFTTLTGTQSDAVFAYQAFAGVRYEVNPRLGVNLEYHYFGTTEPTWRADFVYGAPADQMRFGSIATHTFSIGFDYRF